MTNNILSYLRCPTCGGAFTREGKSLLCPSHHTFDIAKSGYVNLLPPGKGKNNRTGDDRTMVDARVDFLRHGLYHRISDTVAEAIAQYTMPQDQSDLSENPLVFCDMGSGEGYHTCRIAEQLAAAIPNRPILAIGMDASKYAAERAAKLSRERGLMPKDGIGAPFNGPAAAYFIPANLFHTPIADHCMDAAVSMFAPVAWEEVRRILHPSGILVVIESGCSHLIELRRVLYDEVRLSDEAIAAPDGFAMQSRREVTYHVTLPDRETITSLFTMTPFYYRSPAEGRSRLLALDTLDITVDVICTVYSIC